MEINCKFKNNKNNRNLAMVSGVSVKFVRREGVERMGITTGRGSARLRIHFGIVR